MTDDAATPNSTSAELSAPTPLAFVAVCQHCGRPVSYVDQPGQGPWDDAVLWSTLALEERQQNCPAYRSNPTPAAPPAPPTFSAQRRGAR